MDTIRALRGRDGRQGLRPPFRAITFGNVILGVSRASLHGLRAHERVHVRQYEQWGPLSFAAYLVSSVVQLLRGRSPYWHNRVEVQAYREARGAKGRAP